MAGHQLALPLLDFGGEETLLESSDDIEAPDSPPPAEDIGEGQASDDEDEDEIRMMEEESNVFAAQGYHYQEVAIAKKDVKPLGRFGPALLMLIRSHIS